MIKTTNYNIAKHIRIKPPENPTPVVNNIAELLAHNIRTRSNAQVDDNAPDAFEIRLAIDNTIAAEGFEIAGDSPNGARIIGGGERGLLYGAGKFLRASRYESGDFTPAEWRGKSEPEKPVRGIYFATHFYNFYQTAPVEEVEKYVAELALWGVNVLQVWYDMHHFKGFNDPEAVAFRERLERILLAARRLGLGVGLTLIGNEAYDGSPLALRAAPGGGRGGFYEAAVCPNKPGTMDYLAKIFSELFGWAKQFEPDNVWLWPYDQGGCGCGKCQPWGPNGFMKCAEHAADLSRDMLPDTETILSTWFCDPDEWREMRKIIEKGDKPFDKLLIEDSRLLEIGVPPGMPVVGFPEISMSGMWPWGGFGANPQPTRFAEKWARVKDSLDGGFPYSEGIFEDINKALWAQMYWDTARPVEEILSEYIAWEFSSDAVEDILDVIRILEQNHHFRWWPDQYEGWKIAWYPSRRAKPKEDPGAEEAYAKARRWDLRLPAERRGWRWRALYLRALLDSELKANEGGPNETCLKAFEELNRLYRVADRTIPDIRAPIGDPPKEFALNGGAAKGNDLC